MGSFGIAALPNEGRPTVQKLDVNFWCLPALFGRFTFYCDVGVLLEAPARSLTGFRIILPFPTSMGSLEDLSKILSTDTTAASLLFGQEVTLGRDGVLTTKGPTEQRTSLQILAIDGTCCEYDAKKSTSEYSVWTIRLNSVLGKGKSGYARFRFRVFRTARMWTWRRVAWVRRSVVVDMRVNDARESVLMNLRQPGQSLFADIAQVNCFVIVPFTFAIRGVSPRARYTRVLEGRVWEGYLGRATNLLRRRNFLVVSWRGEAVSESSEFRASLDLVRETGRSRLPLALAATTLVVLAVALLKPAGTWEYSVLGGWLSAAWRSARVPLAWAVGSVGVPAVALWVLSKIPKARGLVATLRRWLLHVETVLYKLKRNIS